MKGGILGIKLILEDVSKTMSQSVLGSIDMHSAGTRMLIIYHKMCLETLLQGSCRAVR